MAKMREMDIRAKAVELTIEALKNGTFMEKAEPAGQNCYAYPNEFDINGTGEMTEVWTTIDCTCKMWRPYNARGVMHEAYDPFEVQREWEETLAERKRKADEVAEKKAKKIAKQNKAKEKAEDKTSAAPKNENRSVGGEMVRRMIQAYEKQL